MIGEFLWYASLLDNPWNSLIIQIIILLMLPTRSRTPWSDAETLDLGHWLIGKVDD